MKTLFNAFVIAVTYSMNLSQAGAAATNFDWLEGNWSGCEDGFMQEKAITSARGGQVLAANKILKGDQIVQSGFVRVQPGEKESEAPTIIFYSGTEIVNVARCKSMNEHQLIGCDAEKGSFSVTITFEKGSARKKDHLIFVHTFGGAEHVLNMVRSEANTPECGS